MVEVWVEWNLYHDLDQMINTTRQIGANGIILSPIYPESTSLSGVSGVVASLKAEGFKIFTNIVQRTPPLIPASDPRVTQFLDVPSNEVGIQLYPEAAWTVIPSADKEVWLIDFLADCASRGEPLSYYHGDGLNSVDAVKLSSSGLKVWAWAYYQPSWSPNNKEISWLPSSWAVKPILAQNCIMNRLESGVQRYSTPDDIRAWFDKLPRRPEAISWWLSSCGHAPTDEQIYAMSEVTEGYLTPTSPLLPLLISGVGIVLSSKGRGRKRRG